MKEFKPLEIKAELAEMLSTVEKIKGVEYGIIVRTMFNLHNTSRLHLTLLADSGVLQPGALLKLEAGNTAVLADAVLSFARLLFMKQTITQEKLLTYATDLDADLSMLLSKQAEYE